MDSSPNILDVAFSCGTSRLTALLSGNESNGLSSRTANSHKAACKNRSPDAHCISCVQGPPLEVSDTLTPRFEALAVGWLKDFSPQWRRSSQLAFKGIVDRYLLPDLADLRIDRISRATVLALRRRLTAQDEAGKKLSGRTVNEVMRVLRCILSEAALQHGIANPIEELPRLKVRRSDIEPLSLTQLSQLYAAIDRQYQTYVKIWTLTGLRTAEINGLRWSHVDFDAALLRIRDTWSCGQQGQTKTVHADRDVHLSSAAIHLLRQHRTQETKNDDPVFSTANGKRIDAHNFSRRVWLPALKLAGLKPRRPYQLRHTFVALALAAGESPQYLSQQLGHASVQVLFDTYARFAPHLIRRDGSHFESLTRVFFVQENRP